MPRIGFCPGKSLPKRTRLYCGDPLLNKGSVDAWEAVRLQLDGVPASLIGELVYLVQVCCKRADSGIPQ